MNTNRIDTVLNRQQRNLVFDALYALVLTAAVLLYVVGLGAIKPAVADTTPDHAAPVEIAAPVDLGVLCAAPADDNLC
ncbi:hypothetical protein [Haliangium sp.]|uniref:hypothetical protein n=1 Tax=Haliangium sp. TaxID=2663208 RepID=UPI003D121022